MKKKVYKFIITTLLLVLSLIISACTAPQISPTATSTSTPPAFPEAPVATQKPIATQATSTVTPPTIYKPLPESLEVLYLRADRQIALTDLSGTESVALTPMLTQATPGDEPNVWLQFHHSTPPKVSPAGNRLLLPDGSGGWLIYDLAKQSILKQFSARDAVFSPSFSPDGERLAFIHRSQLCLYSLTAELSKCLPPFVSAPLFADWSPHSDHIAVVLGECCEAEVWLVDTEALTSQIVGLTDLTFETNLKRVLTWVYDADSKEEKLVILSQKTATQALVNYPSQSKSDQLDFALIGMSVNGKYVLTLDGTVGTLDGNFFHKLAVQPGKILLKDWAWSPQSDRLAVLHSRPEQADTAVTLSVISLTGQNLLWQHTFDRSIARVEWSRDSSALLLDQADLHPVDSPVWKISSDGQGELEVLVKAGFLLSVLH